MKTKLISFLMILCSFLPVLGQEADSMTIGYCAGENGEMSDIMSSNAKQISAGILITPGMVESLVGNRVETIRVYLPSKLNVTSLTAWVRGSLDGENLTQATLKAKQLEKGWNELQLETPYEIANSEPFYIGYTFEQKSRAYAVCCTGFYVEGGLFYKFDDGDWLTESKYGNLCVEGVVKGDKLPQYDLELNYVSTQPIYYVGDKLKVIMRVFNHAVNTVKGFTLSYSIDGTYSNSIHVDCDIASGKFEDMTVYLPPMEIPEGEEVTMDLTISAIDGGEDQAMGNNSKSLTISTADGDFKKMVLVEEFTTEECGNCPAAAPLVYGAVDRFNEEHPNSATIICHHAGFYTDFLTSDFDEGYLYLYNGTTFAPAAMVDRFYGDRGPVFGITSEQAIYDKIQEAYDRAVNYSIKANVTYDETSKTLKVDASGSRLVDSETTPTRISVVVVESNIPGRKQSGAEDDYTHMHAMRTANSTWGDLIDWEGYDFNYSCSLEIDDKWVQDNLEVVVYINKYDAEDVSKCNVENVRVLKFPGSSSVQNLTDAAAEPELTIVSGEVTVSAPYIVSGVWTPSGIRVANTGLTSGLYIVTMTGNNKTVTRKIFVK